MIKGASIKFISYEESIPKLLDLLKVQSELKKFDTIILKPFIKDSQNYTPIKFTEAVLKFCIENKNPSTEIFIAEGSDGEDTTELFDSLGFQNIAEKFGIGLIDLNNTETEKIIDDNFLKFDEIYFPKILIDSCVISLPVLREDEETEISTSTSNMLGAFPSQQYSGFFSLKKNKIRKWPIHYSIHDILMCKMPNFAIIDASSQGQILAGLPLDIDKKSTNHLGHDWKSIQHLKLLDDSYNSHFKKND